MKDIINKARKSDGVLVFTDYIGRYVTKIYISNQGDVYQCDGTELDLEGKKLLLALKSKGCEITFKY